MTYRIIEFQDGKLVVAGWGDHATLSSARDTIARWGTVVNWQYFRTSDSAEALIVPYNNTKRKVLLIVRPIDETRFTTQ